MLVLSRKTDESILIDGRIEVTIVQVEGGRVRLGITAPREISIRRSELPPRDESPRSESSVATRQAEPVFSGR